jgi:hypothetical protein
MKIFSFVKNKFCLNVQRIFPTKPFMYHIQKKLFSDDNKCGEHSHSNCTHDTPQIQSIKNALKEINTEDGKNIVVNIKLQRIWD